MTLLSYRRMNNPVVAPPRLREPPRNCAACPLRRSTLFSVLDTESMLAVQSARIGTRRLRSGGLIYGEGDPVRQAFTMFDGYAIRYRLLSGGQRQVLQFVLPGDFLFLLEGEPVWPDTAEVVSDATLCAFSALTLQRLFEQRSEIARAIARCEEADRLTSDEHMTDLGRRTGLERLGRSLLELFHREQMAGRVQGNHCFVPFTQSQIGDALGLSGVHVSRLCSKLRAAGLMSLHRRWLTIPDPQVAARHFQDEADHVRNRPLI